MLASTPHVGEQNSSAMVDMSHGHEASEFEMTVAQKGAAVADSSALDVMETVIGYDDGDLSNRATNYPRGRSSTAGAIANYVNSIVGAGIVGLPFALAQSGLWAGMFMMLLASFLNFRATTMLINAGEKAGRLNYEELMADVFGNAGIYAFSVFAGVTAFGAMAAYLIIVGDTVPEILLASGVTTGAFSDRESVIVIFAIFCILPVSLLKDMSKLSYTSFISVMADVLLTCIVVFSGPGEASERDIDRSGVLTFIRPTIFAGFGAISFAFVSQSSAFLVYRSLAKGGTRQWSLVTTWSLCIALVMGLSLGLGGYLNFVGETEGNILNNFSTEHKAASVARGFLAVTMILTYPMEMYVVRHVLDVSVFQSVLGMGPITSARHYGITVALWVLTITVALSTDDLGSILEIFGAFGANAVGYMMPALLHMKSNRGELRRALAAWRKGSVEYSPGLGERLWAMRKFYIPIFMVLFGFVAMVAGVATAVVSELSPTKA